MTISFFISSPKYLRIFIIGVGIAPQSAHKQPFCIVTSNSLSNLRGILAVPLLAKSGTAKIPLKLLNELLVTMQKGCLCALCGAIPTPIMNILKYFGDEMKNDIVKDN